MGVHTRTHTRRYTCTYARRVLNQPPHPHLPPGSRSRQTLGSSLGTSWQTVDKRPGRGSPASLRLAVSKDRLNAVGFHKAPKLLVCLGRGQGWLRLKEGIGETRMACRAGLFSSVAGNG